MRAVGRRVLAALILMAASAAALSACGDDGSERQTIGILRAVDGSEREVAFRAELERLGFSPDRLEVLGADPAETHPDRDDAEATVRRWLDEGVDLIVALATSSAQAAAEVTDAVPILFLVNDPVTAGLLGDERSPEGNLTGTTYRVPADRALTLAEEMVGDVGSAGCLHPAGDPGALAALQELERGAATLGVTLHCRTFGDGRPAGAAVAELARLGIDVLIPLNAPGTVQAFPEIDAALGAHRIPVVATTPWERAELTLVPDGARLYRQLAAQAARLLQGDAVADVPVEDPARFRLTVNRRSAAASGLTVPASLLRRADQVVG